MKTATKERIALLSLSDPGEAFAILGEQAGVYGDNGGDPDGYLWLAPVESFDAEKVERICREGWGGIVKGWEIMPYSGDANYQYFCGYSGANVAYAIEDDVAEAIWRDEMALIAVQEGIDE